MIKKNTRWRIYYPIEIREPKLNTLSGSKDMDLKMIFGYPNEIWIMPPTL
jgi:hypothetical protein